MRNVHRLVALAAAGSVAGCATAARQPAADAKAASVVFKNLSLHQADVYAVPDAGAAVRIGTVQAGRTDTLAVTGTALPAGGGLTIVADLLAVDASPRTGQLTLFPGDWLSVTLPATGNVLTVLPVPR